MAYCRLAFPRAIAAICFLKISDKLAIKPRIRCPHVSIAGKKWERLFVSDVNELRDGDTSSITCVVFSVVPQSVEKLLRCENTRENRDTRVTRGELSLSALKSQCYFTSVSRREESRAKTRQNWSIKKERIRAIEDTNSQLDIRRDQHRKWVISGDISGGGDKIGRKRSFDELQTGLCWFNAITSSPIK